MQREIEVLHESGSRPLSGADLAVLGHRRGRVHDEHNVHRYGSFGARTGGRQRDRCGLTQLEKAGLGELVQAQHTRAGARRRLRRRRLWRWTDENDRQEQRGATYGADRE